jgi:Concanavalin A-like lectin/glucanases superfamily
MLAAPVVSLVGCNETVQPDTQQINGDLLADVLYPPGSAVPADGPAAAAGQIKPVFVYYEYSAGADQPQTVEADLPTVATDVTPTADRFAQGALCYEFNGVTSSVEVEPFPDFPQGDFALLLWVHSSNTSAMRLLQLIGTDTSIEIDVNGPTVLTIYWAGNPVIMVAHNVASLTDGKWHHVAVQKYGVWLQLFLDGVPVAAVPNQQKLPTQPRVLIGKGWSGAIDGVRLYNCAFPGPSIAQSVYRWTAVKPVAATGNLAGYFPFAGSASNYLGYGVEGTATNVTSTTDRYGSIGAAYLFNGVNSSVAITPGLESTGGDFAVGFWEQTTAPGPMTAFSASSGGVAGTALDFVFNLGAALQIYLDGVAVPALSFGASGALTDGKWHFVFLQRAGSTLQLYVDGTLTASGEDQSIFFGSTSIIQLGAGSGASAAVANPWNGALDDVLLYGDESLTPQQIGTLLGFEFFGRDGVGALSFQGKMWLLGGWNGELVPTTNNEVWSSTDGVNWQLVTRAPWERRHDAGYAVFQGRMWVVGGDRITGHYQNDVWSTADGINWERATDDVPWANRATQYVLTFKDRLWLMGGQQTFETTLPVVAYNDVWSSADGINWQLETPAAGWSPRGLIQGNAVFQGLMWVIGGGQYDVRTFNNDVWSSPDGVNWTQVLPNAPWSPRQFHNITVFHDKLWVMAGGDAATQGGTNDVWYSPDGVQWTQLVGTPWAPRHAASTIVYDNYLWFGCGSDADSVDDLWKMGFAP